MVNPNHLTATRMALTPLFFLVFYLGPYLQKLPFGVYAWGLGALFVFAEVTDVLDGYIARRYQLVSDLGKIWDPFVDIFWRLTLLYAFTLVGLMPILAFIIIMWREATMMFVRHLVQAYGGIALPARWTGKLKALIFMLGNLYGLVLVLSAPNGVATIAAPLRSVAQWLFSFAAVMAIWSFWAYFRRLTIFWQKKK